MEALFNIHVIDTDTPSYRQCSPISILDSGTVEKKRVYHSPVELLQCEASHFVKHLSASLAYRWEKPFSDVLAFVHSRLQFASVYSEGI